MAIRRILQLGDPLLHQISQAAPEPRATAALFDDLRDTLHEFQRTHGFGRGIAAIQIGELMRCIYIEFEGVSYSLVNPGYVSRSAEKIYLWDDCFSFPNLVAYVERSARVTIQYLDPVGEPRTLEAAGSLSELLQHELDHLDGILAVDRALGRDGLATRDEYQRQQRARAAD